MFCYCFRSLRPSSHQIAPKIPMNYCGKLQLLAAIAGFQKICRERALPEEDVPTLNGATSNFAVTSQASAAS
jgi:hypothetical protein